MISSERSYEKITKSDLRRLAEISRAHRERWFRNLRRTHVYKDRFLGSALCQGAALHYVDGENGVKDFDIYEFYAEDPKVTIPYRTRWQYDFGPSKFGRWGKEPREFEGRHVDVMVRALPVKANAYPVEVIRHYLGNGRTETARELADKAVVMLEPEHLLGEVVWPE